jgi:hypothetical protein
MDDSDMTKAEPRVQPMFSKLVASAALVGPILALAVWLRAQPSRWPAPDRAVAGRVTEVTVGKGLRGWRLTAGDERFGGLSALVARRGELIALTDSGVVVRFSPPAQSGSMVFALHDLPGGPGSPLRKAFRDSESLLADPGTGGWWVGFETRHSLWRFDSAFQRVLEARRLKVDWPSNKGAEALASAPDGGVMVLPELGGPAEGGSLVAPAWTSDATRMPDGRLVLLVRRPTWRGFASELRIAPGAGKPARRIALDVGALDNMEGVAAAPLPNGGTRLWIVSDDNFRPWMRTLLVTLDVPPGV